MKHSKLELYQAIAPNKVKGTPPVNILAFFKLTNSFDSIVGRDCGIFKLSI